MWGCEEVVVGTLVNIVEHATSPPHCTSLFFICCHKRPNKPFSNVLQYHCYVWHILATCIIVYHLSYMKNQSCVCVTKVGYRSLFPVCSAAWSTFRTSCVWNHKKILAITISCIHVCSCSNLSFLLWPCMHLNTTDGTSWMQTVALY